jgi:hypothetical protein
MWMLMTSTSILAQNRVYNMDVGLQGGLSYCMGEQSKYAFQSTVESFGVQFRYKINPRWAIQLKEQNFRLSSSAPMDSLFFNLDVTGEYNFFRFGLDPNNIRLKRWTPYVFAGFGVTMGPIEGRAVCYLPLGLGVKWKFADRWQLQAAWQHQIYLGENGDKFDGLDDGSNIIYNPENPSAKVVNILKNDVISTFTIGVIFEFARSKNVCPIMIE